jgi:hypothetical protein
MATTSLSPTPKLQFFDLNGAPLSGGLLYTYAAGTTTPLATYTDSTGNFANTNPIVLDSRGEANVWLSSASYKLALYSATNVLIWTVDNLNGPDQATLAALAASGGSNLIGYLPAGTGAVATTVQAKLREGVSVFDFMTPAQIAAVQAGTSTDDLSAQVQAAVNTEKRVYFPGGIYKFNLIINNKTVLEGDGSTKTIVKPYDNTIAVMTYTFTAQQNPLYRFWDYHSEVRNIGFFSNSAKTGVGFTFGKTNPADYVAFDEFANNVHFFGCYFEGFDKGVQFPFGNIGTEFYSCGFAENKYGVYTLDNKFGPGMHAGNKYFYGGEMHGNDVAVYINNAIVDGFGGIAFYGTIFEYNKIAVYAYVAPRVINPISFDGVWMEGNGESQGGTSTIDSWSGSTRSNQIVTNKSIILDGPNSSATRTFNMRSCFACDVHLKAPNTFLSIVDSRVEASVGFGGGSFVVDYPENSWVKIENPTTDGGWYQTGFFLPLVTGIAHQEGNLTNPGFRSTGRCFQTNQRGSKVTNYGPSRAMSSPLTAAATTGSGSFGLVGTVVSDGIIYNQCNEFTRAAFASSEFTRLDNPVSTITTSAGWYVFTLDANIVSGAGVRINVWNRSTVQLAANLQLPSIGKWYTVAAVGYSVGGETLYLDFSGNNGDVTWRISAYQIHRFNTEMDAWNFINSNVFAES